MPVTRRAKPAKGHARTQEAIMARVPAVRGGSHSDTAVVSQPLVVSTAIHAHGFLLRISRHHGDSKPSRCFCEAYCHVCFWQTNVERLALLGSALTTLTTLRRSVPVRTDTPRTEPHIPVAVSQLCLTHLTTTANHNVSAVRTVLNQLVCCCSVWKHQPSVQ